MTQIKFLAAVVSITLVFMACRKKEDTPDYKKKIIGKWMLIKSQKILDIGPGIPAYFLYHPYLILTTTDTAINGDERAASDIINFYQVKRDSFFIATAKDMTGKGSYRIDTLTDHQLVISSTAPADYIGQERKLIVWYTR